MDYLELENQLKRGRLPVILHLSGDEPFLLKNAIIKIENAIQERYQAYAGRETYLATEDFGQAIQSFYTPSIFGDGKLVVVESFDQLVSSGKGSAENILSSLQKVIAAPPECAHLALISIHVDKRLKIAKFLSKSCAEVVCNSLKPHEIEKWVNERLREENLRLAKDALNSLLVRCGNSLENLHSEIEKLKAFAQPKHEITEREVRLLVEDRSEEPIYMLYNALDSNDSARAYQVLKDVLAKVQSPIQVVAGLSRHIRLILALHFMKSNGMRETDIRQRLEVSPYQLRKLSEQTSSLNPQRLQRMLLLLENADERMKKGSKGGPSFLYQAVASYQ